MRLVDADKCAETIADLVETEWGYEGIKEDVKRIFDEQPTAYDVDKVVKHINDYKKDIDNAISDDEFFRSGIKTGLTMAIEAVKKGGIE